MQTYNGISEDVNCKTLKISKQPSQGDVIYRKFPWNRNCQEAEVYSPRVLHARTLAIWQTHTNIPSRMVTSTVQRSILWVTHRNHLRRSPNFLLLCTSPLVQLPSLLASLRIPHIPLDPEDPKNTESWIISGMQLVSLRPSHAQRFVRLNLSCQLRLADVFAAIFWSSRAPS